MGVGRGRLRGEGRVRGRDDYNSLSLSRSLSGVKGVSPGRWPSTGCLSLSRGRKEFTWGAAWVSEPTGKRRHLHRLGTGLLTSEESRYGKSANKNEPYGPGSEGAMWTWIFSIFCSLQILL